MRAERTGEPTKLSFRVVLHARVFDVGPLDDFVERCLRDGVRLIAIVGPGCRHIEDLSDEIVVSDGCDPERFALTTSHRDESLEDVLEFTRLYEMALGDDVEEVVL